MLSETLVQVTVGFGFPSAEQFKVNSAGAVMVWSLEVIMLLGAAKKANYGLNVKRLSNETQKQEAHESCDKILPNQLIIY